jgi:hypothetical protein
MSHDASFLLLLPLPLPLLLRDRSGRQLAGRRLLPPQSFILLLLLLLVLPPFMNERRGPGSAVQLAGASGLAGGGMNECVESTASYLLPSTLNECVDAYNFLATLPGCRVMPYTGHALSLLTPYE